MRVTLRPYQVSMLDGVRRSFATKHRAPLLVAPTGAGKTTVFSAVCEGAAKKGSRVYILVHRHELLMQASRALDMLGVPHGLVSPRFSMTADMVQIASVQTIVRRMHRMPEPDLIIVDECHHATSETYRKILEFWGRAKILGVSATPERTDSQGLGVHCGGIFDDLVAGPEYSELEKLGFLVPPRVFAPPPDDEVAAVDARDKDATEAATDKPTITGNAVDHYRRLCSGETAAASCCSIRHAVHVTDGFKAAGYQWAQIDGKMDDAERDRIIKDLGRGLHGVSFVDLVSEGFDLPRLSALIGLRKTWSVIFHRQFAGRAARPDGSKKWYWLLDHVGNTLRHGMPNEDREWTLDGARVKKKSEEADVAQCKKCFAAFPAGASRCPECDGEVTGKPRKPPEQVDGELTEVTAEQIEFARREKKREEGMAQTLEDFQRIGQARGYSPKWAAIRWKLRQDKQRRVEA